MPNIKSAAKHMRQSAKRREHNRGQRAAMRTAVKKARTAVTGAENPAAAVTEAISQLAKMAQKGQIHKNKAARLQSRLTLAANKAAAGSA